MTADVNDLNTCTLAVKNGRKYSVVENTFNRVMKKLYH